MITFQELILKLTHFWEKQGCVIHQGHDLEVGAGTFNPATFLRCLGPEPYKAAYVEPSRRPADGRFGQNPNRLQLFHQYQVILKPSPPDVQKLYLESLEAMGFELKKHDIRFVHDDWESPTLGAWGLGWEVWCDGMEVSQFTYFQAMASLPLKPITAEITYGLERLCMFIQNVDNIFDIQWNETFTLRDLSQKSEEEWSAYNFQGASVEMWRHHFEDYEKEARRLIEMKLPIPAYDFVVKASHAFNLLEARGVISTTERTGYIARIRELARSVAIAYLNSREELGFPLLKNEAPSISSTLKIGPPKVIFDSRKKRDFLLEIGSEQLPASFVSIGEKNLLSLIQSFLEKEGISFDSLHSYSTPRRLAVLAHGVAEGTEAQTVQKKGPAVKTAFKENGELSPQGEGFFKSIHVDPIPLHTLLKGNHPVVEIKKIKDVDYLFATLTIDSKSTMILLQKELVHLIESIDFPKKMKWGSLDVSYARPIHWIVALFGHEVVHFTYGDVNSSSMTYGHAQRQNEPLSISSPTDYLSTLRRGFVIADSQERADSIKNQIKALETNHSILVLNVSQVLPQVVALTEWPELTLASFASSFLTAPQEILTSEMIEHQKYFPVAQEGKLAPFFIITCDNIPTDLIREGNQRVLSARLSDGIFLYQQDLKFSLEHFNQKLRHVTFQKELGSMREKVSRMMTISALLASQLSFCDPHKVERAAFLSKADLASSVVREFPELQGIIGKYYALAQKEDPEVAEAIEEHWMPRSEGAPLPITGAGTIVSLADKIDNLISFYSVGLKPTSSSDPYGLRRQSIGLLRMLIEKGYSLNLKTLLTQCIPLYKKGGEELVSEILNFVTTRAKGVFEDMGFKKDEIEASLRDLCKDPYDQYCQLKALHTFRSTASFKALFEVYKRAKGQLTDESAFVLNKALLLEPSEEVLFRALEQLRAIWKDVLSQKNYTKAYEHLSHLQTPLAQLFDQVKILADDVQIRQNRMALLQEVFRYFSDLVDLSQLQHTS